MGIIIIIIILRHFDECGLIEKTFQETLLAWMFSEFTHHVVMSHALMLTKYKFNANLETVISHILV